MRVSGSHRPASTAGCTSDAAAVPITAEGADFAAARNALRAQVPDDHQLLHIIVEG